MAGQEVCETDELQWACEQSKLGGAVHVDVAPFIGAKSPVLISADNLLEVIKYHEDPQVSVSWDDKTLTVAKTDGGIMAYFTLTF